MNNIIMPHSEDAEKSLIASCLYSPENAVEVCDLLTPEHFWTRKWFTIFTAVREIVSEDKEPAIEIIADRLKGQIESPHYELAQILDSHPVAPNIETHAELVIGYKIKRDCIEQANAVIKKAQGRGDAQDVLDFVESSFGGIELCTKGDMVPVCEIIGDTIDQIEVLGNSRGSITGIPTGYKILDKMTSGWQNSDLIILAGRPSMGKTSLGLNFVQNAAQLSNVASAIFSIEMSKGQLVIRLITTEGRVNSQKIRNGNISKSDWVRITDSAGEISEWYVYINDTAESLGEIRRSARKLKRKKRLGMVVIDYLQLMHVPGVATRAQEIGDITRGLKKLAKELNVPVIALSQLNRKLEERSDKRPQMSDLRDSGAIEQDADVIMFLYRDEVYNRDENNPHKGVAELNIAKQRNGPTGPIRLTWLEQYTRFEDYAPEVVR